MDHPIRPLDMMPTNLGMATALDELEYVNLLKREMAFHMLQVSKIHSSIGASQTKDLFGTITLALFCVPF